MTTIERITKLAGLTDSSVTVVRYRPTDGEGVCWQVKVEDETMVASTSTIDEKLDDAIEHAKKRLLRDREAIDRRLR